MSSSVAARDSPCTPPCTPPCTHPCTPNTPLFPRPPLFPPPPLLTPLCTPRTPLFTLLFTRSGHLHTLRVAPAGSSGEGRQPATRLDEIWVGACLKQNKGGVRSGVRWGGWGKACGVCGMWYVWHVRHVRDVGRTGCGMWDVWCVVWCVVWCACEWCVA